MAAGKKFPITQLEDIMSALASSIWSGSAVGLFTSDITPALTDTLSTYTAVEAAWSGYARQAPSFGSGGNDGTHGFTDSAVMSFPVTSGGTGTTVFGYFIIDTGGTDLIFAERIASPISVLDGFPVPVQVRLRDVNA